MCAQVLWMWLTLAVPILILSDADHPKPKMAVINTDTYYSIYFKAYVKPYGDDILIQCSSEHATDIEFPGQNGDSLPMTLINATTVQVAVGTKNLGLYAFTCQDRRTVRAKFINVHVVPAMSLNITPRFEKPDGVDFVTVDEEHEVICTCSGPDNASLFITTSHDPYQIVRRKQMISTVSYDTVLANRSGSIQYTCSGKETISKRGMYTVHNTLSVFVDYYPESHDFSCVVLHWSVLECYWRYKYSDFRYSLSYKDLDEKDDSETLMCFGVEGNIVQNICSWNIAFKGKSVFVIDRNISLVLETCNFFAGYCRKEMFNYKTNSLVNLGKVSYFSSYEKDAGVYKLDWFEANLWVASASHQSGVDTRYCPNCEYKVEYRPTALSETWRLTATSVVCDTEYSCSVELHLPYPDSEYEVRVSARLIEVNRMWSDPSAITVHTHKRVCACDAPQTPETADSPAAARCQVCRFREYFIKESLELLQKIKAIKKKIDKAKVIDIYEYLQEYQKVSGRKQNDF